MIHKLQSAINGKGDKLLYNTAQFFSEEQQRPITMYYIKKAVWDDQKHRNINVELFKSTSQIQIVLFLRDYWFQLNGWDLPTDNESWNKMRDRNEAKEEFKNGKRRNEQ